MGYSPPIAGTNLGLPSWAGMSRALVRSLQLLLLVALFLGGTTSHEVAMAGGMGPHADAPHMVHSMDHGAPHDACNGSSCELDSAPCCVMGQCLLGIFVAGDASFFGQPRLRPRPQPVPVLIGSLVDVAFRPPAVA
jgi:hypothetical protein